MTSRHSEFLRCALGITNKLSFYPSNEEWEDFFVFCKKQAILGIGFRVVEKLHEQGVECPKPLKMQWMMATMQIEARNRRMNEACKEVTEMFARDGFEGCILKGQGNLMNYPEKLGIRRQSGDIDIWVTGNNNNTSVNDILKYVKNKSKPEKAIYHHIDMPIYDDVKIEVHYRVGHLKSPVRNMRMQKWFKSKADECMKNKNEAGFSTPTISVNAVYQMAHIFMHFFDEGIGLRQLIDYYFVLKAWKEECTILPNNASLGMWSENISRNIMSAEEVMHVLSSFGMTRFTTSVMWVLQYIFDMPDEWCLCKPDEKVGRILLKEIMLAGNFGQHDERGQKMKTGGMIPHAIWKLKRIIGLVKSYPEEALCEPFFRVWHLGWRMAHGRR